MESGVESVLQVAKIKLKVGSIELEYEGDPSLLVGGIEALLETMGGLAIPSTAEYSTPQSDSIFPSVETNFNIGSATNAGINISTNTVAAHLEAKSGPDLVLCAMAQLEIVQGKTSSSRSDILTEMKSATNYYSESIRSNLSSSLATLVKNKRINQISKDTYALSASERKQLGVKIASIG
jgi:hypothetical protein